MEGSFDSTTLTALAVTLTAIATVLAFVAWRRRGPGAGLKGLAWALVPVAALLTGTLRLAVGIVDDVVAWAARLVFSPVVWTGLALAGVAVVLYVVGGMLTSRGIGVRGRAAERAVRRGERAQGQVGARQPRQESTAPAPHASTGGGKQAGAAQPGGGKDDDMDEIEAILRKHGI